MSVFKLIESTHPMLKLPIEQCSDEIDRNKVKEDLIDSMKNYQGIGLSANQIGIMERVFVMYSNVKEREIIACFNPQILSVSDKKVLMDEGCLSYPGLWLKVSRPDGIEVSYEDENVFVISHKQDTLVDKFRSTIKFEKVRNFSHVSI